MKAKVVIALLVFLSNLLFPKLSFAEETNVKTEDNIPDVLLSNIIDSEGVITPLKKNQRAPYDGVLLSPVAVATIITQIKSFQDQAKLDLEFEKKQEQANCQYRIDELTTTCNTDKKVLMAQLDQQKSQIDVLSKQLDSELKNKPNVQLWTGIGVGVGFVVGVGLSALTIYAIGQASN